MEIYKPNVIYTVIHKSGKPSRYHKDMTACFSDFRYNYSTNYKSVVYLLPIDKSLQDIHVNFYLDFLSKMLDKSLYNYTLKTIKKNKYLSFVLDCTKIPNGYKAMLYLTAIRYLVEFPEILIDFYNKANSKKTIKSLFKVFQLVHFDAINGVLDLIKYNNISGHGLIYRYGQGTAPILLEEFHKNWNDIGIKSVQNHFVTGKEY